jgi:outer membrane receptor protein involved in Fe transport
VQGGLAGTNTVVNQTQNIGDGKHYGFEVSADTTITHGLQAGVRYTYINRNFNAQNPINPPLPTNCHLIGLPIAKCSPM